MKYKWVENEILFLKNNYEEHGAIYCSRKLGKSKHSVAHKAKRLGLKVAKYGIWKYSEKEILEAVKNAYSYSDALRNLNINPASASFTTIKNYIARYNVDISHFTGKKELYKRLKEQGVITGCKKNPIEYYFVVGKSLPSNFKKRLYDEGLKKECCELCGQDVNWNGNKLILILDHINGNHMDNRLKNLRIICPNCDSTLNTYCFRNIKRKSEKTRVCKCGKEKDVKAKECIDCYKKSRRRVERPSYEQLMQEIKKTNYCAVGKKYGVSDNAIRKWLKDYKK